MSLLCLLGRHTISIASISRRPEGGHKGFCEACALPLERDDKGRWRETAPLASPASGLARARRDAPREGGSAFP